MRFGSLLVLLALAAPARAGDCPAGYREVEREDGALECSRPIDGASYREYLVLVELPFAPERVIGTLWQRILDRKVVGLKRRDFVSIEPKRIVFYDQIKTPVVSDRDYTCESILLDQPNGRREIRYVTRNDLGPPLDPHYTRIPYLRAAWVADPDGHGGTHLSYVTYSEPGGSVPAWMVRGAQAKHAMTDVADLRRALR